MKHCSFLICEEDWDEEKPNCFCGEPIYKKCKNYIGAKGIQSEDTISHEVDKDILSLPWHANAMGSLDIEWLSAKRQPLIIGVVGHFDAGKSTLLANLYMLLRSGKSIGDYSFAGSYTLLGWEKLAHFLSFHTHKMVYFPPHTSANVARIPGLLHVSLKDKNGQCQDVLFTDAPGEWFTNWANVANAENSKGARWVNENADAFIVVADSKAFHTSLGKARGKLLQIVERMKNTHQLRPTAFVWAKSDVELDAETKAIVSEQVKVNLPNAKFYDVAVINHTSEDLLNNVLKVVNQLLTEQYYKKNDLPEIEINNRDDFFFSIRSDSYARKK